MTDQDPNKSFKDKIYKLMHQIEPQDSMGKNGCSFDSQGLALDQMKAVLAASPAGIGIITNQILNWANDNFYAMLGYEYGAFGGKDLRDLFSNQKEYEKIIAQLALNLDNCGRAVVETRLLRKGGNPFDCQIRSSRLDLDDPKKGMVIVITDISELKILQIQLQQAQKMEAIGVLAGGISHDFNNILMGIQGHLSLMRIDVTAREKVSSHIHQIGKLVDTGAELTGRLLGFARGGKYQIEVLEVNQVVGMALNILKPSRKELIIHESYAKDLHRIDGDYSQLEQVCLNILINASQSMNDKGELFVSTQNFFIQEDNSYPFLVKPGQYIRITIRDTGMGMDMEIQKKIFDPFFSTKEIGDKKGRGLGLSTVFGIVKNHGGFITVDSERGKGASFHVCLPASNKLKVKKLNQDSPSIDAMLKGSETILLVDDEEEILNTGKNFLIKLGYKAITARNGLEAVELFRIYKDDISLVVMDLIMPKMDGQKAVSELKNIRQDIKILVATGYAVDDKVEELLDLGCQGLIQKPFSMYEFSKTLRSILDKDNS